MKFNSIGVLLAMVSISAIAQSPPTVVPSISNVPLAKHSCGTPAMPDTAKTYTANESNAFVRTLEVFRTCIQTFAESQKIIVVAKQKEAETLRQSAVDAFQAANVAAATADAAVKEYNTFSEQALRIVTPKAAADVPSKSTPMEPPPQRPMRSY